LITGAALGDAGAARVGLQTNFKRTPNRVASNVLLIIRAMYSWRVHDDAEPRRVRGASDACVRDTVNRNGTITNKPFRRRVQTFAQINSG
jgi:hypothetical protein